MSSPHEVETVGSVTVLRLRDPALFRFEQLAATSALCQDFLENSPTRQTLIDFGQIEFYNSMSLGLIASLGKHAERCGRTVSLCNLHPRSIWSIQATRLHTSLDVYHNAEQALAALQNKPISGDPAAT
jgi:anti-anti-sigma factor